MVKKTLEKALTNPSTEPLSSPEDNSTLMSCIMLIVAGSILLITIKRNK